MFVLLLVVLGTWFERVGQAIRQRTEDTLAKLSMVTDESPPSKELQNLWNQVKLFEQGVRFLENDAVVSKWTWLFCGSFLALVYLYLAFVFSFAYYGIARVRQRRVFMAGVSGYVALHTISHR